jgi:quinol monooxygenase YgiN
LASRLYQETTNPSAFHLQTHWKTEDELMQHLCSDEYKELLLLVELSVEPPSIEFHTVSETRGAELIHEVREG